MPPAALPTSRARRLNVLALLLGTAGVVALVPVWSWLLLAVWIGALTRPLVPKVTRIVGGRGRAAALVTVAIVFAIALPVAGLLLLSVQQAIDLGHAIADSDSGKSLLKSLVSDGATLSPREILRGIDPHAAIELAKQYGAAAWVAVVGVSGTAARFFVGAVLFFWGTYAVLAEGPRAYSWLERQAILEPLELRRLAGAFVETGRGVLIGQGVTGLVQGALATIAYASLGVPRALFLGSLTFLASLVPALGSGLIWVPVAAGLALTGSIAKGIILFVVGIFVIGGIDNVLRPFIARYARLDLPPLLLFASMFGGFALFGAFGLLLGPLFVRLGKEALAIRAEAQPGRALVTLRGTTAPTPLPPTEPVVVVSEAEARKSA
jgi:predicted PurR-regulated permease PerM